LKRVILDEGVPRNVARHLPGHDVTSVLAEGWSSVKNGKLLGLIERAHFDAFITNDKKMEAEGQLRRRPFATLLLSTNHWPSISPHVAKIAEALDACEPGSVTKVDCGTFVPRRLRKPETPSP
jgi:hypothetical protein